MAAWQREALTLAKEWAAGVGRPDVIHVHDFSALAAGHELAREWQVPFLYDTHEYWVGRPVEGRPASLRRRTERRTEDRLVRDAAAVVTVGDGVAAALRADHPGWPEISVVRNTFPLRDDLPDPLPTPAGLVYGGRLAADRELEVISRASLEAVLPITLLGPGDDEWLRGFDPGRCRVLPAESLAALDQRLLAAGAALVTHSDRWPNHRLAMPNKLFHAVSLGLPVVATDVGELGALVREHRLGTLYRPGDASGLVRAIADLVADYPDWVARVRAARPELSWERDAQVLRSVHAAMRVPR
jgi:glycogen(starch) synthase